VCHPSLAFLPFSHNILAFQTQRRDKVGERKRKKTGMFHMTKRKKKQQHADALNQTNEIMIEL